jgi:hypothetical protein
MLSRYSAILYKKLKEDNILRKAHGKRAHGEDGRYSQLAKVQETREDTDASCAARDRGEGEVMETDGTESEGPGFVTKASFGLDSQYPSINMAIFMQSQDMPVNIRFFPDDTMHSDEIIVQGEEGGQYNIGLEMFTGVVDSNDAQQISNDIPKECSLPDGLTKNLTAGRIMETRIYQKSWPNPCVTNITSIKLGESMKAGKKASSEGERIIYAFLHAKRISVYHAVFHVPGAPSRSRMVSSLIEYMLTTWEIVQTQGYLYYYRRGLRDMRQRQSLRPIAFEDELKTVAPMVISVPSPRWMVTRSEVTKINDKTTCITPLAFGPAFISKIAYLVYIINKIQIERIFHLKLIS